MRFVRTERLDSGGTYRLWTDGPPQTVSVGDAEIWEAFTFSAESWVRPGIRLELRVRVIDGVPQCIGVSFHSTHADAPVTDAVVQELRLEHWIEVACSRATDTPETAFESMEWDDKGEPFFPPGVPSVDEVTMRARKATRQARRSRRGHSDELLRQVGEVYEANVDSFPTRAVRESFEVAQSTAQLYVKKARERGFITAKAPPGGRP